MTSYKTQAYIQSLNEELITPTYKDEISITDKPVDGYLKTFPIFKEKGWN